MCIEMTRIAEDVRGGDGERTKVCERIAKWSIFRGSEHSGEADGAGSFLYIY